MKYPILLLLLIITIATPAAAQDNSLWSKGRRLATLSLSGDASSATVGGTDVTSSVGSLNVQFGYFVADRIVIGLDLASITQTMEVGTIEAESSAGQLGLFAAYYFRFGGRHAIYPELRLFGGSQEDTDINGNTDQYDLSGATLGIGYAYAINNHIALDVKLRSGNQTETDGSGNEFESGVGQFRIGFQIVF